ncbi:hypothetical protein GCM10022251_30790 [Phytohabitans flavus]|uniref:DAK2 domain-containing protein n=1 Tax=Phytohabitans flavus TaxID=1076124 RepID=UPI0031EABFA4
MSTASPRRWTGLRTAAGPVDWPATAAAALAHAQATAELIPLRGRASYVGERAVGNPDAGAMGVALLFWALALYRDPTSRHRLTPPAGI